MTILIDIGNTRTKVRLTDGGVAVWQMVSDADPAEAVSAALSETGDADAAVLCSTGAGDDKVLGLLNSRCVRVIRVGRHTPVPIRLDEAPQTVGADRVAAAVGAHAMFPGRDVLVADLGTAMTFDAVGSDGKYCYGTISPGLCLRMSSLNTGTSRLPLCSPYAEPEPGTTLWSIWHGVVDGTVYEIEGRISAHMASVPSPVAVLTGGDAEFFGKMIKSPIFVESDLVFAGLQRIADFNAE